MFTYTHFKEYDGYCFSQEDLDVLQDFIDVNDVADAHLEIITIIKQPGYYCYNIGNGNPTSVKSLVNTFSNYIRDLVL